MTRRAPRVEPSEISIDYLKATTPFLRLAAGLLTALAATLFARGFL